MSDVPAAVDDYADIPADVRARLKARMTQFAYDDIVTIRRDAIDGNFAYEPALLDMHFGKGRRCGNVTRKTWRADHEERGLAYCESGHCVVVPMVCRNVSRILRRPGATTGGGPAVPAGPLTFEPPGAGLPASPEAPGEPGPTTRILLAPPATPDRLPPFTDVALPPAVLLPPAAETPPGTSVPALPPLVPALPQVPGPVVPFPGLPTLPPAPLPAVPEPTSALLWAVGLLAAAAWGQRQRVRP